MIDPALLKEIRESIDKMIVDDDPEEMKRWLIKHRESLSSPVMNAEEFWKTGKPEKDGRYLIIYHQGRIERPFIADYDAIDGWHCLLQNMEIIMWAEIPKPTFPQIGGREKVK